MTYQHALRYITQPTAAEHETIRLTSLMPEPSKSEPSPVVAVCFSNDKIGQTAAALLESILCRAGISALRWADIEEKSPKQRFTLKANPLSPPLLSDVAGQVQQKERALRSAPTDCLSRADRCAAVLAECVKICGASVLLLQSETDAAPVRSFGTLFSNLRGITVISQNRQVPVSATLAVTREVISLPCGPAMFRHISDACVTSGSRLSLTRGADCRVCDQSLGSRTIQYRDLPPCRIFSSSPSAADALFLALECVLSLRREGLTIPDSAVAQGTADAQLPYCCSVLSIQPLVVADQVQSAQELARAWMDISAKLDRLPLPRALWLDPELAGIKGGIPDFVQQVYDSQTPLAPSLAATSLIVGSATFIEKVAKSQKEASKS